MKMNEQELLQDLLSEEPALRQNATRALWDLWFSQVGEEAELQIREGTQLMNDIQYQKAHEIFKNLVITCPEFSEAHNKLATVLYLQKKYSHSIKECEITLKLNPNHFGAWNGLGLCLFELARYPEAIKSFQTALILQPYAEFNKIYIAKCRGQLN
jgi:tetratricopeptide (TPR) repeat protein